MLVFATCDVMKGGVRAKANASTVSVFNSCNGFLF